MKRRSVLLQEFSMADFPDTRISLILRLGQNSDVQAWQEFAEIYAPAIHGLATRRGLQPADADDITQEILFGVARAIERFQPDASRAKFRTWLSRIARNLIADFCEGRAKRPISQSISDSWLEAATDHQNLASIEISDERFEEEYRSALFQLAAGRVRSRVNEQAWQAFQETAVHGKSAEETAEQLDVTVGNVYVCRCRVLKLIRIEVEQLERAHSGEFSLPPQVHSAEQPLGTELKRPELRGPNDETN